MIEYQHFPRYELACKCGNCDGGSMDKAFMERIVAVRSKAKFPFIITSAFRCSEYNAKISTTGDTGPHTRGRALDIYVHPANKMQLLKHLVDAGFTRFGFMKRTLHVDDLLEQEGFSQTWWTY